MMDIVIETSASPTGRKDDPNRETKVIFRRGRRRRSVPLGPINTCYYEDGIKVDTRASDGLVIVYLNVNNALNNREYRALVRSLFGWRFGGVVFRRMRSHRRWNGGTDNPYLSRDKIATVKARVLTEITPNTAHTPAASTELATT